ncbi:hypothetical protein CAPTEDRAFT_216000, partial [Capitella teleta]
MHAWTCVSMVDIDECLGDEGVAIDKDCHTCKNTQGSYTCECDEGYERHPNEKMCIDVDECERELYDVGCHTCINLIGGHTCLCNETFILDTNMNNETCMGQPGKPITSSFDGRTIAMIVGLVVFLVLTAFALFATVIFVRQRKEDRLISRNANTDDIPGTESLQDEVIRGVPNVTVEQAPPLFAIKAETAKKVATPKPNLKPKPKPEEIYVNGPGGTHFIAMNLLKQFVKESEANPKMLNTEYKSFPKPNGETKYTSKFALKSKQRFGNIIPCMYDIDKDDHNRVKLEKIEGQPLSDYINASHVQGTNGRKYIASQ